MIRTNRQNYSYYLNNLGQDHALITTAITNTYQSSSQKIFHVPHSWLQPSRDKYNGSERKLVQQIYITSLVNRSVGLGHILLLISTHGSISNTHYSFQLESLMSHSLLLWHYQPHSMHWTPGIISLSFIVWVRCTCINCFWINSWDTAGTQKFWARSQLPEGEGAIITSHLIPSRDSKQTWRIE